MKSALAVDRYLGPCLQVRAVLLTACEVGYKVCVLNGLAMVFLVLTHGEKVVNAACVRGWDNNVVICHF